MFYERGFLLIIRYRRSWFIIGLETLTGGVVVCPGDTVVTECLGIKYLYKKVVFESAYEPVSEKIEDCHTELGGGVAEIIRTDGSRSAHIYPVEDTEGDKD